MMKHTLTLLDCVLLAQCAADPAAADLPPSFHATGLTDIDKPIDDDTNEVEAGFEESCGVAAATNMLWAAGYDKMPDGESAGSAQDLYESIVNDINTPPVNDDWSLTDGWTFEEEKAWMDNYTAANANGNPFTGLTQQTADVALDTSQLQSTFAQLADGDFIQLGIKPEDSGDHFITLEGFEATLDENGVLTGGKVFVYDSNGDLYFGGKDEFTLKLIDGGWYLVDYRGNKNAAIWSSFRLTPIPGAVVLGMMGLGMVGWWTRSKGCNNSGPVQS